MNVAFGAAFGNGYTVVVRLRLIAMEREAAIVLRMRFDLLENLRAEGTDVVGRFASGKTLMQQVYGIDEVTAA